MAEDVSACFLLLMRHRATGTDGESAARDVAETLADTLSAMHRMDEAQYGIKALEILHADSPIASETASIVQQELARKNHPVLTHSNVAFSDMHATPYSGNGFAEERDTPLRELGNALKNATKNGGNAVIAIGHQPLLSVIAQTLVPRAAPWLSSSIPLARSEIACLTSRDGAGSSGNWKLLWTISPTDSVSTQALREKITAKMTVAGILGGVVATGLVLLLQGIIDQASPEPPATTVLRYAAAAAMFIAVWLYLSTVYACDRLLMPTRFWAEARNPADLSRRPPWLAWRPPGSDAWIIYQNMLHIWRWQFLPATCFLIAGIGLLGVALQTPTSLGDMLFPILATVLVIVGLLGYTYWRRPHLGVED